MDEIDPVEQSIMLGKIDAAEFATAAENIKTQSKLLINRALKIQEELGTSRFNSEIDIDRIEAIGQLVDIIDRSSNEIDSYEDIRNILEVHQELSEIL